VAKPKQTHPDRSSALVFFLLAIAVGIEAFRLNPGKLGSPGPGLTPLLYASVLGMLALILFLRGGRRTPESPAVFRWPSVLSILSVLLVYGLLIEYLGYLVCTFVAMILLFRMGKVRWPGALLSAASATAVIHLLFVRWLAVPLPIGSVF